MLVVTEQLFPDPWLLNLNRFNAEDDIVITPEIGREILRLMSLDACVCDECKPYRHMSDCAVHNEPAYPNRPCSCRVNQLGRKDLNVRSG